MIARSFRIAAAMTVAVAVSVATLLPANARAEFKVREMTGFAESYFSADFSQPGDWPTTNDNIKASVADGQLTVVTQKNRGGVRLPVKVGPAAGWRAQADVRIVEKAADDKSVFVGMGFSGGAGGMLFVSIDSAGNLSVEHLDHTGKFMQPDPVANVRAPSARTEPGATNTLAVERQDGYFRIFVNGEYVTRTRVIDFTPRWFGVMTYCSQPFTASFDNLSMTRTRYDSRFQRLLGQDSKGIRRTLLKEDFARQPGQQENWLIGDSDRIHYAVKDGAYYMRNIIKDEYSSWIYTGADFSKRSQPGIPVSTRFSASVECVAGDCDYSRGILVASPKDAQGNRALLRLEVSNRSLRVVYQPVSGDSVKLLDWTTSASLNGPLARLNLVLTADDRVLVFVNDDFQVALPRPQGFVPGDMALYSAGMQDVKFDDLDASHF